MSEEDIAHLYEADVDKWVDVVNKGVAVMIRTKTTTDAVEGILALVEPVIRAEERERIAQAIEALPIPGYLDAALLLHDSWRRWRNKVARIARNGGSGE